jgi:hypothetical protein
MTNMDICSEFNKIQWHDSKLRSFGVVRQNDRDDLVIELELREGSGENLKPTTLTLVDAAYFRAEVDFDGKYQCADDISSASCDADGSLRKELLESKLKHSPNALDGYYCFDIYLIPPGGRIQVFARSYELRNKSQN